MKQMNPLFFIILLSFTIAACGISQVIVSPSPPEPTEPISLPEPTTPISLPEPTEPVFSPKPTKPVSPTQTNSLQVESPSPTTQPSQAIDSPVPATTRAALYLTVFQPLDETVTDAPQIEVIGMAPPETVVTVNDEILIVGQEQEFKVTVTLEEGPNLIEIIASDIDGNETSQLLTVFYEP